MPGVAEHGLVAPQDSVAGALIIHIPFPPTQVYGGFDAPRPQAEGQVGAVHVPVLAVAEHEASSVPTEFLLRQFNVPSPPVLSFHVIPYAVAH